MNVILINHGRHTFPIANGEPIDQLVNAPVTRAAWSEVDALDETIRGAKGFGSAGHD